MTEQTNLSSAETNPLDQGMVNLDTTVLTADATPAAAAAETVQGAEGEKPAEAAAEAEKPAGAPEAYDIKAPEGSTLDVKALEGVLPVFKDLNLTNEAAQKLTDAYATTVLPGLVNQIQTAAQTQLLAEISATRKEWADTFARDPEIGGNDEARGEKLSVMAKAIDDIMGPRGSKEGDEFRTLLNETGLGNNPTIGRLLYRVGSRLAEAAIHHSQAGTAGNRTMAEKMYDPAYHPKGTA